MTSLTGYQTRQVTAISDVDRQDDGNAYALCSRARPEVVGQPVIIQSVTGSREDRDEFSQDLRLNSDERRAAELVSRRLLQHGGFPGPAHSRG